MQTTASSTGSSVLARCGWAIVCASLGGFLVAAVSAQPPARPQTPKGPWMDKNLSADQRADLVVKEMTLDEKINMLHGRGGFQAEGAISNGGAGVIQGVPRLGLPPIQLADSAVGVRAAAERGRYSTLLPSTIAAAATWDLGLAYEYGEVIGRELRDQQYQSSLGAGVNLMREPRNGRNFEYPGRGPDPRRQDGRPAPEGVAEPEGHRGREALRLQRPGDRTEHRQRETEQAHHARDGSARFRDRGARRPARDGHVLVQQGQRRLGLRERLSAEPAAEEDLGLQGRGRVRLERDAQHRQGGHGGSGLRAARSASRTGAIRRCDEEGGRGWRGPDEPHRRHGTPDRSHRVRSGRHRRTAARPRRRPVQGRRQRPEDRGAEFGAAEERQQPPASRCRAREVDRDHRVEGRHERAVGRRVGAGRSSRRRPQPIRRSCRLVPELALEGDPGEGAEGQGRVSRRCGPAGGGGLGEGIRRGDCVRQRADQRRSRHAHAEPVWEAERTGERGRGRESANGRGSGDRRSGGHAMDCQRRRGHRDLGTRASRAQRRWRTSCSATSIPRRSCPRRSRSPTPICLTP